MAQDATSALIVSSVDADRAGVAAYLLPILGLSADRVRTDRDFDPGRPLVDEFARAVDENRDTLLVLSPAVAVDRWATLVEVLAGYLAVEGEQGRLVPPRLPPAELGLEFTDPAR